jgi:hypothetical protein
MSRLTRKIIWLSTGVISLFFVVIWVESASAGSAVLNWNANSEPDLAGYKIYYDTASKASNCPAGYANNIDAGNVITYTINNLPEGHDYYFQLTAHDTSNNESACSTNPGEVTKTIYYKGDMNKDRLIDIFDYNILVGNFGQTNCGNQADADGDCTVGIFDYNQLVADFGKIF